MRARARVLPSSETAGACAGLFTYDDTEHDPNIKPPESDMEVLTHDPETIIRITNQPDFNRTTGELVPGAQTKVTIDSWRQWSVHRLDWFSYLSRSWYNGQALVDKTYGVPHMASSFIMNMWSDGGFWTKDMSVGDEVYLAVEWFMMGYNASDDQPANNLCTKPCKLDGLKEVGKPERIYEVVPQTSFSSMPSTLTTATSSAAASSSTTTTDGLKEVDKRERIDELVTTMLRSGW